MHAEFSKRFKRVSSNGSADFTVEETDSYINEGYRAWYKDRVAVSKTNSKVRFDLKKLQVPRTKLTITEKTNPEYTVATLPGNYYDIQSIDVFAKKQGCDKSFKLYDVGVIQTNDWNSTYSDPTARPSFLWRRSFFDENAKGIRVGKYDFEIESVFIEYYRIPTPIYSVELDPDCYSTLRGTFGVSNKPFELDLFQADEVIDAGVMFAARDTGNLGDAKSQFEKIMSMYRNK